MAEFAGKDEDDRCRGCGAWATQLMSYRSTVGQYGSVYETRACESCARSAALGEHPPRSIQPLPLWQSFLRREATRETVKRKRKLSVDQLRFDV